MKKIVGLLLVILLITNLGFGYSESVLVNSEVDTIENIFTDLENHWAKDAIMELYNFGGINGYPDGTFEPDDEITKVEFLALTIQTVTLDEVEISEGDEHWGDPFYQWAYDHEIVSSSDLDESTWDDHITRYDMAKIIVRSLENIIGEEPIQVTGVEDIMSDYDTVNESAAAYYVKQAFAKGIINGKNESGLFAGEDTGTRAEASTLILRLINPEVRVDVNITESPKDEETLLTPEDELTEAFIESFIEGAINETNNQRSLIGVHPLEKDELLVKIAQYKSDDMVMLAKAGEAQEVYFSHESPTYGDLRDLTNLFDLSRQKSIGENLAWRPYAPVDTSPEALGEKAVLLLKTSSSHYEAIINENYFKIGIGVSYHYYEEYNSGYLFVTQTFSD